MSILHKKIKPSTFLRFKIIKGDPVFCYSLVFFMNFTKNKRQQVISRMKTFSGQNKQPELQAKLITSLSLKKSYNIIEQKAKKKRLFIKFKYSKYDRAFYKYKFMI